MRTFLLLSLLAFSLNLTASCFCQMQDTSLHDDTELLIPTFLGNEMRNYYGEDAPSELNVIWRLYLGEGETTISRKAGNKKWAGAGWTGQPLLVREKGELYLIQGAFDHNLKKIEALGGKLIWEYRFDDVVKGTGTIWKNPSPTNPEDSYLILQGSRLGEGIYLDAPHIPSYRAISLSTGREMWRLDVKYTGSYSRDVDGSALILNDTAYIALENSMFVVLDPSPSKTTVRDGMTQPHIISERVLFTGKDLADHGNNVVTESSPALLGDHIYIASGSGHVYGYNIITDKIDWDFYIGSDIDGSAVVTSDSCILISVEKQYIRGDGGVFKLNPRRDPEEAVVWFQPAESEPFADWEGGVIGSAGINDFTKPAGSSLVAAFSAIDGYTYIVRHDSLSGEMVKGPDGVTLYPSPSLVTRRKTGQSIATPVFAGDRLLVTGYGGLWLYRLDNQGNPELLDHFSGIFESTPVIYDRRIYVASRDGYLYCLGEK